MTTNTNPTSKRNNKAWIAGLAAGLIAGGGAAMVATLPGGAGATTVPSVQQAADTDSTSSDTADTRGAWLTDALAPLVEDGTITQAQADAVVAALEDARPDHGGFGGGRGGHIGMGLEAVAEELGLTTDEIRSALEDGQSLADLAAANGSSADALVSVLVAEAQTHLDEHVADGDLTQAEADERLADMTERITAMVNGEMPTFEGRGPGGRGPGGHGPGDFGGRHGSMDSSTDDSSTDDGSTDESGS
jgi:polyhydroxyalkanoate synthesis regulator phasin